jgi:2-polyprenyl-3-methyl-5-hydroxy-6-metoxy-1,4-benzoquinol methylase
LWTIGARIAGSVNPRRLADQSRGPAVLASAPVSSPDPVRDFFDTRSYLDRNAIIPVRARILRELLEDVRGGRVLDLGCGDGSISRSLLASQNQLTLVDFSARMLDSARSASPAGAPIEFIEADILDYVPTAPYDAVICVGVLAHVRSVPRAIERVSVALRPGGLCVLQTTDNASPLGWLLNKYYRRKSRERYELNTITLADLLATARLCGLTQTGSRRYGLLLPGLGNLPYVWERRMEEVVGSDPRLSRLGAEVMVCFEKRAPAIVD